MNDGAITLVGIGADGWAGLGETARAVLRHAPVVAGASRQLDLLPADEVPATRRPWPSPLDGALDALVEDPAPAVVLASGDPMLHGLGGSLVRRGAADRLVVLPHPSAFALACARECWAQDEVELISAVAAPLSAVARVLQPGRRLVVYVPGDDGAARLARLLVERGFGASPMTVLERLGSPDEQRLQTPAHAAVDLRADPLHCVALTVRADAGTEVHALVPGLADDAYDSDGQLTKRHVRAATLAALGPLPGQRLWDVGAGSGSIAIEWLRAEPSAQAVAVEAREDRLRRIEANAERLGVPRLRTVHGRAPQALDGLDPPDAVFIGGGITTPGLLQSSWEALRPGGRLVANTVTLEGERLVGEAHARLGGTLVQIAIASAQPVGGFTGWRAQMPVVQWTAVK